MPLARNKMRVVPGVTSKAMSVASQYAPRAIVRADRRKLLQENGRLSYRRRRLLPPPKKPFSVSRMKFLNSRLFKNCLNQPGFFAGAGAVFDPASAG